MRQALFLVWLLGQADAPASLQVAACLAGNGHFLHSSLIGLLLHPVGLAETAVHPTNQTEAAFGGPGQAACDQPTPPLGGVFVRVTLGLGCTTWRAITCLALFFSPWTWPAGAKSTPSARLPLYARIHRSSRAQLRAAQSSWFRLSFPLEPGSEVRHKHDPRVPRLGWARAPNKVGWPVATGL
jgi:hypothetical protein